MSPETKTKKKTTKKTSGKASKPRTAKQLRSEATAKARHADELDIEAAASRVEELEQRATEVARAALDVPVGAALNLNDRVSETVEEWSDRNVAEKKVKRYRADLTKTVKKAEKRGAKTRRKARKEVKKTYNRIERDVRKRRKTVEKQIRTANKDLTKRIDGRVSEVTKQAEKAQAEVTKVAETQGKRAQELVNRVTEQLTSLV